MFELYCRQLIHLSVNDVSDMSTQMYVQHKVSVDLSVSAGCILSSLNRACCLVSLACYLLTSDESVECENGAVVVVV